MTLTVSKLEKFSPTAKVLAALCFACVVAVLKSIEASLFSLVFSCFFVLWSRPERSFFLKRLGAINLFIVFLWLFTPWATKGTPLSGQFDWISKEGIELCFLVTLKANALFGVFIVLVSSLSFTQLATALQQLRLPNNVVALLLFTARGISIFENEFARLKDAAYLRGFNPKLNVRTYQTIAAWIALLFVRAFRKSRILEEAMVLRGFDGKIRTITDNKWSNNDTILIIVFVLITITIGVLGWS